MSSECQLAVKPDSSTAAGTLLMTWLVSKLVSMGWSAMSRPKEVLHGGTCAMLPENTKKQTNVASSA